MEFQDIRSDGQDTARGDTPVVNDDLVVQSSAGQPVVINAFANDVFGTQNASLDPASAAQVTFTQPEQGAVTFDPGSGLFTFVPAPGQQGPVQFTYTITDADGDTATATVVITLAPGGIPGASVIAAATNGTAVPDVDDVIVLPPGVTLDDVTARGRDLVIQLPDGTQQVIADGAINVPQIVVDGVAVPPSNFAALLVGAEAIGNQQPTEPGAGPPRSSGSNFFEAARPIQRAFDIGDLLPPTAFNLAVEPREEVIPQRLDRGPTLVIVTVNQPVGAADATANVAESGLPARAGEPAGSNAAANTEATSGTIQFASPDGITSLTINGVALTGAGQTFTSPRGTLTITSFDAGAGTANFTYTLTDNLVGGTVADQFTVILTDPDGDVATSTLTINVADDAPTARNDTDALAASVFTAETGNVITAAGTTSGAAGADTLGADNATITRVASNNVAANTDTSFDAAGNLQVAGQYGTLLIRADGSYSYTRAAGTPGGVSEAFTYTLTDADGSASTATLTIAIGDARPAITSLPDVGSAATIVAESGLPARGAEAPGSNAPAPTETTSGTITFTSGDGPATATINGVTVAVGAVVTIPGVGALTVTGFNPVAGTITYTFTLADNTSGDTTSVTFNLVVTDVDGDTAPGSFTIAITDDVPLAVNDSATQGSENAAVTVNVLGNDIQGADSVALTAVAAVPGTLSGTGTLVYDANGSFTYTPGTGEQGTVTFDYTITDGDGDTSRATVTIALLPDSTPTISVAGDNTVSEAALPARGEEPAGSNAASPDETAAGTIAVTTGGDTLASLVINGVNVTAGGTVTTAKGVLTVTRAEGAYAYSYTLSDNTLADPDSDTFSITVTDSDGDTASTSLVVAIADDSPTARDDAGSVAAGTYGPISGSVTANDTPGADGIVVLSYAAGESSSLAGSTIAGQYGTLSINASGTYTYTRNAGTPGGVSDSFSYAARDGDGDLSTANLVIAIADSGTTLTLPPAGTPGSTQVLEAGLPAGSAAETNGEFASGSFSFTAPDGPATVTIGGTVVTIVGQTIAGSFGTLTITSIAAGSIGYTYRLATNTSGDNTSDSFAVVVTDKDGDASTGTLTIAIVDDVPTARADIDSVKEDGPLIADGSVVTGVGGTDANTTDGVGDEPGADGVRITGVAFVADGGATTAGTLGTPLAGAYGSLTLPANGRYIYTLDNANTAVQSLDDGEKLTETFTYTIIDLDGDPSTTTLTITIDGTNDAPVVGTGAATVSEEGLANANADTVGSTDTTNAVVATGTISITDADVEPSTVTLGNPGALLTSGGVTVTWSGVGTGTLTGSAGDTPVIRIAIDNLGAYTVTLLGPVDQATANVEDVKTFTVPVSVSDGTATVPSTLTVTIEDDSPLAANDTDAVTEDGPTSASGNVLTGVGSDGNAAGADSIGADGPAAGGAVVALAGGTVGLPLAGTYGSLTLSATGGYTYALNNADPAVQGLDTGETLTETFTYTIRDRDGDTATATLTVTINGTNDAPVVGTGTATVSEEGLKGANVDAVGNTDTTDSSSFSGTISITDADVEPSTVTLGNPGAVLTSGGVTVTWSGVGTGTLTGSAGDTPVIRIAIDNLGAYTVTLLGPVDQATANVEDIKTFVVPVSVSDGTATVPTTLTVTIEDDSPLAANDTDAVTEDGPTSASGNVLSGVGSDGNVAGADSIGADGPAAGGAVVALAGGTVGSALAGTYGSLTLGADGSYTYALNNADARVQGLDGNDTLSETFTYTVRDRDGDTATATLVVTINGANDPVTITGLNIEGGEETVFEANLADGSAPNAGALTQTGTFSVAGIDGIATITVGGLTVFSGGTVTIGQTFNAAFGTLTITAVTPVTDGAGDTVSATIAYSYTLNDNTLAHPAAGSDSITDSFAVTVTDSDGSTKTDSLDVRVVDDTPTANPDTNMVDEGAQVGGNVLTDGTDDVFGADGAATTTPAGGVVGVAAGSNTAVAATGAPGTPIETALGFLTLRADGSYTYQAKPNTITADTTDSFTYTIRDSDGDVSTTTLIIALKAVNGMVADTDVDVDESGLDGIGSQAAPNGEFDTNGQITVTGATGTFIYTLTGSPPTPFGTLTLNAATGAYSYTLTRTVDNATANDGAQVIPAVESYGYQVTDQSGNLIGTGAILVNVKDDVPTLTVSDTPASAIEGQTVNGTYSLTAGADGVSSVVVTYGAASATLSLAAGQSVMLTQPTGTLVVRSDGTFGFTAALDQDNDAMPAPAASFTISATDGDGDVSMDSLTIGIVDGADAADPAAITLAVDERLLNTAGATGSMPGAGVVVDASPTLSFTAGTDSLTSFVFGDVSNLVTTLDGVGPDLFWTRVNATTITGSLNAGGPAAITLTLSAPVSIGPNQTGAVTVTFTLADNVPHALAMAAQTQGLGFVTVLASDNDGATATGRVNLTVTDDVPTAANDTNIMQGSENAAFTIDALANDTFGADGVVTADASKVVIVSQATQGVVSYSTMTGLFTYTPNAGAGSTPPGTADSFTYKIIDGDGDESTATVSITLQPDSTPMVKATTNLEVDEDGLMGANADNGQANPTETNGTNSATASGTAVFSFGNDVPATLAGSAVLVDSPALDGQLVTLGNQNVVFGLELNTMTGRNELVGRAGNAMGVEVIRIALTGATAGPLAGEVTYSYSTTLSQPVRHATAGTEDTDVLSGVTIQVTDRDNDTTTGSFDVVVRDDVPSLDVAKGDETATTLTTQDAQTAGNLSDTAMTTANFAGVFSPTSVAGADGANTPALSYVLNITGSVSGLASNGAAISLYKLMDGTIVGSTSGTNPGSVNSTAVFSLTVSSTGVVTLTQFQQIDHPTEMVTGAPFDDQLASLADGLVTLTASATITDGDGDTATDSEMVSIGANIRFADDGPVLSDVATNGSVSIDETAAGPNFPAPIMATSMVAVISATSAFGADGIAATGATVYGLTISGGGMTPLATAIGNFAISLVQTSPNTITGQYTDGTVKSAFTLAIGTDGRLTVTQNVALEHLMDGNTAADYDDELSLAGLVNATITLKDFDGDTAFESRAIGGNIVFRDDGPSLDVIKGAEAGVLLTTQDANTDGTPTDSDVAVSTAAFGGVFSLTSSGGADGAANTSALAYALNVAAAASGLSSHGQAITLVKLGDGTVVGYTGTMAPTLETAASVVFSVKVSASGIVTLTQLQQIDHTVTVDPTPGGTPFTDHIEALATGKITLTATASITDNDGDTASDSETVDLGGNLRFADDGPSAVLNTDTVAEGGTVTRSTDATGVLGNDASGADGYASTGGVIGVRAAGGNTTTPVSGNVGIEITGLYGKLTLNSDGTYTYKATSNAITANQQDVFVYTTADFDGDTSTTTLTINVSDVTLAGGNIVAQVDEAALDTTQTAPDLGAGTITGSNPGSAAETVTGVLTVTGGSGITFVAQPVMSTLYGLFELKADGTYTYTLTKPFTTSPAANDGVTVPSPAFEQFTYMAMDSGGNAVSGTIRINIQDDVPRAVASQNAVLGNGMSGPVTYNLDGNTLTDNFGADSVGGTVQFSGNMANYPSLSSNGVPLTYSVTNNGLTLSAMAGLNAVFTVTLNPNPGGTPTYSVQTFAPVDSTSNVNFNDGTYDFLGGNDPWAGFTPLGQNPNRSGGVPINDDSSDLLLTPIGTQGSSINGNANAAGAGGGGGGQNIESGEGIRLDFVQDLTGDFSGSPANYQGNVAQQDHNFDSHYSVNNATVKFGDGANNTTITLKPLVVVDGPSNGSAPDLVRGTGTLASVTAVTFRYDGDVKIVTFDPAMLTKSVSVGTVGTGLAERTYSVTFVESAAGSGKYFAQVTGVLDTNLTIATTAQTNYQALEILYISGDSFDLTGFGTAAITNAPVSFALPFDVVDGDGDRAASFVDITLKTGTGTQDSSGVAGPVTLTATAIQPHLIGTDANDTLIGNASVNVLIGGKGADTLTGNAGNDTFVIDPTAITSAADDTITDYAVGDTIDLRALFASLGALAPMNAAQAAASIKLVNGTTNGSLQIDADGTGPGTTFVQVALLGGNPASISVLYDFSEASVAIARVAAPVALDLDGGGVQFQGLDAGTTFNYGDDASRVATAWVGKGDGLLAIDLNANHQVDSGKEIVFATGSLSDLEGLAAKYDSNHDGVLDASDADFAKFGVWQDADGDGVSDAGEFHTLGELGIASIALVSDGQAYTAAGGDVTVAGSSTYTRADGTTGTVADAAFATAPLDRMAAKTAELAATNVAAAGVLAAAAAALAAMPAAAAEPSPAAADAVDAPAALALQALPESHETLRAIGDPLTSHGAVERAPDTASHGETAAALPGSNLAAPADHAAAPAAAAIAEHVATNDSPSAGGFSGDAGQLMDALLAAAQAPHAGVTEAGQHAQDLAAVQEAFGDSHGAALIDAVVDHFAGAETATAMGGDNALVALFDASVAGGQGFGGESFGPAFDLNQMLSDMSAHAAAQV